MYLSSHEAPLATKLAQVGISSRRGGYEGAAT